MQSGLDMNQHKKNDSADERQGEPIKTGIKSAAAFPLFSGRGIMKPVSFHQSGLPCAFTRFDMLKEPIIIKEEVLNPIMIK